MEFDTLSAVWMTIVIWGAASFMVAIAIGAFYWNSWTHTAPWGTGERKDFVDAQIRWADTVFKAIATAAAMLTIGMTLLSALQTVERSAASAERESKKPFLEQQMELYFKASETTAILATAPCGDSWNAAYDDFQELYWGPLSIVESPGVKRLMVDFGKHLVNSSCARALYDAPIMAVDDATEQENSKNLHGCSYQLAIELRKSLADSGNYSLAPLIDAVDPGPVCPHFPL